MSDNKFDALVFCGRFQPFHNGHKAVIEKALEAAKEVIVVVGSSHQARSIKNPFTFDERKDMIEGSFPDESVKVVPVMDYPYDDNAWVTAVQNVVNGAVASKWKDFPKKIGLIGHSKDSSSYYLKIFPMWRNHIEVDNVDGINATENRTSFFKEIDAVDPHGYPVDDISWWNDLPVPTVRWMKNWAKENPEELKNAQAELREVENYQELWKAAPYPPTFVTTDAVIHQSGYVLLIKRAGFPFEGKWALPGGYLDRGQFIKDNMIKELREETCIKVPEKVLKGSIKRTKIFDHPDRDPRGRTITHGFFVDLGYPDEKLPKVKGADDAKEAQWFHLGDIVSDMMAFDHYHIIKHFIPTY